MGAQIRVVVTTVVRGGPQAETHIANELPLPEHLWFVGDAGVWPRLAWEPSDPEPPRPDPQGETWTPFVWHLYEFTGDSHSTGYYVYRGWVD